LLLFGAIAELLTFDSDVHMPRTNTVTVIGHFGGHAQWNTIFCTLQFDLPQFLTLASP